MRRRATRRLMLMGMLLAAIALPAEAHAHSLSFAAARGETYRWARTNALAVEAYAWGVGNCRRLSGHVIDCSWWSKAAGRNGGATIHCDNVVRVRLGRFGIEQEYPAVNCYAEGFPNA